MHREIAASSSSELPVLIIGETGVGKEHVARLIHMWSKRSARPFIALNCAAIPHEMLEAEMFGIGKGVATGVSEREGYFQRAHGGTLFLDEVGDMSPQLQAKLLRALQEKEVRQIGGAVVRVDCRVVSATNQHLPRAIDSGSFRRDLYFRLAGVRLHVPPLRARRSDIPTLIQHFLRRAAREAQKPVPGITLEAVDLLCDYGWPGNVRELEHEVQRLVYVCEEGRRVGAEILPGHVLYGCAGAHQTDGLGAQTLRLDTHVRELEVGLIRRALIHARGNQSRAAKLLGISRQGLAIKMERLGLTRWPD